MGTRSLTHIQDEDGNTLVTLYRQFDGYPTGMGADLKEILNKGKAELTNGYSGKQKSPEVFNGMGCLAAYLIGALKHELHAEPQDKRDDDLFGKRNPIGNVYIQVPNTSDVGEEYVYTLKPDKKNNGIALKVLAYGKLAYAGTLKGFNPKKVEKLVSERD